MNNNIASLLTNVYEIEGLLLVVTRHGQDTPSLVYKRIQKAAKELHEQCQLLDCGNKGPVVEEEPAPAPVVATPPPMPEPEAVAEPEEPAKVPVEDREPDDDIELEFIYADDDEEQGEESIERSQQDDEDMPAAPFTFAVPASEPVEETPEVIEEAVEPEVPATATFDEPVYEPVHRDPAKDLRKSLSLNDYYRFRRELFQGDEAAMNEALDLIQEMRSASDVEDYFINELEWDKDSDDVQYFMEIVRNHFA